MKKTKKEVYERQLFCILTEDEIREKSKLLAQKSIDMRSLENEKKSVMTGFKNQIDEIDVNIQKVSQEITSGKELKVVKCVREFDWVKEKVTEVRTDTGEIINGRKMAESEKQMEFL